MTTNRTYLALAAALLLGVAGGVYIYAAQPPAPAPLAGQQVPQTSTVSLTVQGLYADKQVAVTEGETALEILQALSGKDPQLQLATKEYAGLGSLVVAMHGLKNGSGGKYWQYRVNGVMPQIGAGDYKLKSGDTVEWFFGSSQE